MKRPISRNLLSTTLKAFHGAKPWDKEELEIFSNCFEKFYLPRVSKIPKENLEIPRESIFSNSTEENGDDETKKKKEKKKKAKAEKSLEMYSTVTKGEPDTF